MPLSGEGEIKRTRYGAESLESAEKNEVRDTHGWMEGSKSLI